MKLTPLQHEVLKYKGILHDSLQAYLSTAFIDVYRGGTGQHNLVWDNIIVNASRSNVDAPDTPNVTAPVIVNWTIHSEIVRDLRNGDTLVVKIPDRTGVQIADAFRGTISDPSTLTSRKTVNLLMAQLGRDTIIDEITPLPQPEPDPEKYAKITIRHLMDNGDPLQEEKSTFEPHDKELHIQAKEFHGWVFERAYFNGEEYQTDEFIFTPESMEYEIEFIYSVAEDYAFIRQFAAGRFRRDNGQMAQGFHTYQAIPINHVNYEIILPTDRQRHIDIGSMLQIRAGSRLLLSDKAVIESLADGQMIEVQSITPTSDGFLITYMDIEPTLTEIQSYITNSYGVYGQ